MKQLPFIISMLGLVSTACDDEVTTSPTNQTVFGATLAAASENPPITGAEGSARGSVTITFTPAAAGYTVDFAVSVSGFPATSAIIAGHIHEGASSVNGPVRVNTGLTATTPMLTPTGSSALTFTGIPVDNALAQAIFANPGGYYFNLHTPLNPGGVVRGQLVRR